MPFYKVNSLKFYRFNLLDYGYVEHGIFTRYGGVSPEPWDSLNVGGTVGDDPERVLENRRRMFHALGCDPDRIYDVWQVHEAEVVCTVEPRFANTPHKRADAILTDRPGVHLLMRFADCVPIMLFDPAKRVIGLVHAGWKGTIKKTVNAAIQNMKEVYYTDPQDILAGIGPSIGPDHYQVGEQVYDQVRQAFGSDANSLLLSSNSGVNFDLWAANTLLLHEAGIRQIELAGLCTACHVSDWFSHRQEMGKTGRFGAIISLRSRSQ